MKEIVIKGSIDELVECEFYLIMVMGYGKKREEKWNNGQLLERITNSLMSFKCGTLLYITHLPEPNITAKQFLSQFK